MDNQLSQTEINILREKGIEVRENLGSGSSGVVFSIAPYKGNDDLCIKYFYDYPHKAVEKEYERYRRLYYTEPGMFCRAFDLVWVDIPDEQFPDKKHHAAAMVMERLKPLDELNKSLNNILKILFDCLACLGVMHIIGINHRDPKSSNIMYCERTGKYILIDYGVSYESNGTFTETKCTGTFYYISPESLRGCFSKRSDLYSLGMVIREMCVGREFEIPEDGEIKEIVEKLYQTKKNLPSLDETKFECPGLIRIVNKLTRFDREERYPDYRAAIKDVVTLLKSSNDVTFSKEMRPASRILLVAVNDLYCRGMNAADVSQISRQNLFGGVRTIAFPVSDRLYMTANQNNKPQLFTLEKPSPFIKALNRQIERINALYRDYRINPEIQLCVVGVSDKIKKRRNGIAYWRRKKAPAIHHVDQIMVSDTLVDFGGMGVESVVIVNHSDALKQYLSDNQFPDSLHKE